MNKLKSNTNNLTKRILIELFVSVPFQKTYKLKVESKCYNRFLYNYFLLISLILFSACGNVKNDKSNSSENQNFSFTDSTKLVLLIAATIEFPELQEYLGGSYHEKQLVILNNQKFKGIEKLRKFGEPILLMTQKQINDSQIVFYIKYEPIKIKNDTAHVEFNYSGQNINVISTFVFEKNQWNSIEYILAEY